MSERTIRVHKKSNRCIRLTDRSGNFLYLPEEEIDAIIEDIKNLR